MRKLTQRRVYQWQDVVNSVRDEIERVEANMQALTEDDRVSLREAKEHLRQSCVCLTILCGRIPQ